ncbi:T9SS type A sorting domain-containing protein [Salinimicrobium soli]|uniref:T9SS type A sorting domain-containing protein n=1 Tax=Salinimicrobium soli TaxID=1254399 RepID=UPI003AB10374
MRGLIPFTAFLFAVQICCAQLTVKPSAPGKDNFLYVKADVLFVGDNIHLEKNNSSGTEASIYLRREGQLIQGKSQKKSNSGTGSLSVFQKGSTNAYDYNYWASPVGTTAAQNALFGIPMLQSPLTSTNSSPVNITSGLNGTSSPLTISNRWIYTFSGKEYSSWNYIGSNISIPAGLGFTMKGVDGKDPTEVEGVANNPGNEQRYDFRGLPNSGDIEVAVAEDEIVLVGNPYPSLLDLSLFLLENSGEGTLESSCYGTITRNNATTGIAYFWDSKEKGNSHYLSDYEGGYGAFSPIDPCTTGVYERPLLKSYGASEKSFGNYGKHYERRSLPIAQGFMLQGVNGSPVKFRNAHRYPAKEGNSGAAIPSSANKVASTKLTTIPKVRLEISFDEYYTRSLTLAFWSQSTPQIDKAMDAIAYNQAPTDAGWLHEDTNYIIDVRPFNITDQIPLFLKVENRETQITISNGLEENSGIKNILILDSETNSYHDISEAPFHITLQPGNYHSRFKVAFTDASEFAELPGEPVTTSEEESGFSIFQNNLMQELEIVNKDFLPLRSVAVFDLQGKKLYFRNNFPKLRTVSIATQHWATGVYLVKVTDAEGKTITKKISVYKR